MKNFIRIQFSAILAILSISLFTVSCSKDEITEDKPSENFPTNTPNTTTPQGESKLDILRTAKDIKGLSEEEKEIFFYLNYARQYPKEFSEKYITPYAMASYIIKPYAYDERKKSLEAELTSMKPVGLIYPDDDMHNLAECFATQSGVNNIVGHSRAGTSCVDPMNLGINWAENISYGYNKAQDIVIQLLIDAGENNAKLGHRKTCLSPGYNRMGVSIKPHRSYQYNAVMDFTRK